MPAAALPGPDIAPVPRGKPHSAGGRLPASCSGRPTRNEVFDRGWGHPGPGGVAPGTHVSFCTCGSLLAARGQKLAPRLRTTVEQLCGRGRRTTGWTQAPGRRRPFRTGPHGAIPISTDLAGPPRARVTARDAPQMATAPPPAIARPWSPGRRNQTARILLHTDTLHPTTDSVLRQGDESENRFCGPSNTRA